MTRSHLFRRMAPMAAALACGAALAVAEAAPAIAEPRLVETISCNSGDPWSRAPLRIDVDVYNNFAFPKDGAPPPVLYLSANTLASASLFEYTVETTVHWTNVTTGARGHVVIPSRGHTANWEGSLPAGHGTIAFTVFQKIGALAFVPMVNPQFSSCRGVATV